MPDYQGPTDKATPITLPSAIEQIQWTKPRGAPGGRIGLEVFTHYVGNNAEVTVALSDAGGAKHEKIETRIVGNYVLIQVAIPREARTRLTAEVKLPKHGLSRSSAPLPLAAPFTLGHARWDRPVACRGDTLPLTADAKGLPDGAEVTVSVWLHDPDGAHERLTAVPALVQGERVEAVWSFDYRGDMDAVAETHEGPLQFFYRVEKDGVATESNRIAFIWVALELVGEDGRPVPGERYILRLPDGTKREGRLGSDGRAVEDSLSREGECKVSFPDMDEEAWERRA